MSVPTALQAAAKAETTDTLLFPGGATVSAVYIVSTATAGNVVLRDGGATGPILLDLDVAAVEEDVFLSLPGKGFRFAGGVHVVFDAGVTSITVFREV